MRPSGPRLRAPRKDLLRYMQALSVISPGRRELGRRTHSGSAGNNFCPRDQHGNLGSTNLDSNTQVHDFPSRGRGKARRQGEQEAPRANLGFGRSLPLPFNPPSPRPSLGLPCGIAPNCHPVQTLALPNTRPLPPLRPEQLRQSPRSVPHNSRTPQPLWSRPHSLWFPVAGPSRVPSFPCSAGYVALVPSTGQIAHPLGTLDR